jgi:hypothetical protein
MKVSLKSILLISIIGIMTACNNNQVTEEGHEGHDHSAAAPAGTPAGATTSASLKDDKLDAVFQQYKLLTAALTEGNVAEAKVAALAIETGAKQIPAGTTLATTAAQITNGADIEAQRTSYASLNDALIALLKASGLNHGELYIAHCPMALNDKGASWVSNSKEIKNPYFGEEMLTCGSVKETVN